jgi:hypothetical protein
MIFKRYELLEIQESGTLQDIEVCFIGEYLGLMSYTNFVVTKYLVIPTEGINKGKIISITPDQVTKILELNATILPTTR